jgi:ubiquinone/menaquinone biosynthesis C-methylase UbiE
MNNVQMTPRQQFQYEYDKAMVSMGSYIEMSGSIDDQCVIDFGCGWGGETLWLKDQGASRVIGVDTSLESLRHAKDFCGEKCEFFQDLSSVDDNSVDIVFSSNVFEHVMDIPHMLDELLRVLKPNGQLISRFSPLFYSPYGAHFIWARPYPYSHLILGRKWFENRVNRFRGSNSKYESWEHMGLNRMTFDYFRDEVYKRYEVKKMEALSVKGIIPLTKIPVLRKYFIRGCEFHAVKSAYAK